MHSAPWFREQDGWWYFYRREGGKRRQIKLVQGKSNEQAAIDRWHVLCGPSSGKSAPHADPLAAESVAALLDLYLDWCQQNKAASTYAIYRHHLESFAQSLGADVGPHELKPKHVTAWLQKHSWSDSTKAGAAQTVRTAFHWLVREGHIAVNPVAAAKAPAKRPREIILSADEYASVLKNSHEDFQRLVEFLRRTGCRPQEAIRIEARHVDLANRRVVFPASEAKGKRHPRVIYLDDQSLQMIAELSAKWPAGMIFRTARGKPWDRNKVRCRFRRLREKVGGKFCAYHLRHTFATDALQKLDPITVASLMGHADASTLARNYQHLAKLPAYMQEAAKKATG